MAPRFPRLEAPAIRSAVARFGPGLRSMFELDNHRFQFQIRRQVPSGGSAARTGAYRLLLRCNCVATPIPRFIALELRGGYSLRRGFVANLGPGAVIAVLWVESVIDVALEVGGAMKPGAGTDENAAIEPFRPVVAVGNAVIRSIVIVTVRDRQGLLQC